MESSQPRRGLGATILLAAMCGAAYSIALPAAGFFDNEGRYAEVAREMRVRLDFVTPFLNGVPFLNKPPLTAWLIAFLLPWVEPAEWTRLISIVAAVATLVATVRLGTHWRGSSRGLVAGALLATAPGFVLEARTLRPDALLVTSLAWAMLCLWHAEHAPRRKGAWLVGFYAALGLGVLVKGFVPLVLAAPPVAVAMFGRHGWDGVRRLRPLLGIAIVGAIVLPWNVMAASRNPGFVWDFVVNQHVLFALAKKEPRDSEGDPLLGFLSAFVARAAPWIALVPLALRRRLGTPRMRDPWTLVPWAWLLAPLVLFALTPSRLEHYALPALPAMALLAAGPALEIARAERPAALVVAGALALLALAAGVAFLVQGPSLLASIYWIAQAPGLAPLLGLVGVVLGAGGAATAAAVLARRGRLALGTLVATVVAVDAIVVSASVVVAPLFSWKPVAEAIEAAVGRGAEVVFEAPIEYQLVGGLDFYLGREVTLLEPTAGFVPPTYLERRAEGMFLSRGEFERRWHGERPLVLVSDPLRRRDGAEGRAPGAFVVLARFGDRWVLGNQAAAR